MKIDYIKKDNEIIFNGSDNLVLFKNKQQKEGLNFGEELFKAQKDKNFPRIQVTNWFFIGDGYGKFWDKVQQSWYVIKWIFKKEKDL